jgi:hypothetical protein
MRAGECLFLVGLCCKTIFATKLGNIDSRTPDTAPGRGSYYLSSFQTAARSLNVEVITAPISSDAEIEAAITSLGREASGGLVVSGDTFLVAHRETIIFAAAQNKVPINR